MLLYDLPKAELHCHLDGSVPIRVLKRICREKGIPVQENQEEFCNQVQAGENCKSLTEYLEKFELPLRCMTAEEDFFETAYETAAEAAEENVRYMEIRFAPLLSETDTLSGEQMIEAAAAGLEKARKEKGIYASLILCGMRHFQEGRNLRTLELARRFLGKGVCGLDLAGDESAFPNEKFLDYFRKAVQEEIPLTVHSGECGRKENILLAAEYKAMRIGHGIAMKGDRDLQEIIQRKGIGVEMCPSSNLQTKAVSEWREYPIREFMENGVAVSVNTDNRTVTNTNLTTEFQKLEKYCALTEKEAGMLTRQAVDMSFAEMSVKKELIRQIKAWESSLIR